MENVQVKRDCSFCDQTKADYSCPKCGHYYCSLKCYKSEKHLNCSEIFYRKCVEDELRLQSKEKNNDDDVKRRTMEIIRRQYENMVKEDEEEQDFDELKERLDGIHLKSENELWSELTEEEKENFERLLKRNEIVNLLPVDCWTPWYLKMKPKRLVEELDDPNNEVKKENAEKDDFIKDIESNLNELNFKVPELSHPIRPLSELTKIKPSPNVKCTVVNILFSYCYVCRHFNNEHLLFGDESYELMNEISLLNRDRTVQFASTRQAVQFTIQLLINEKRTKTDLILILIDDLKYILENENQIYLHILSDLNKLVKQRKQRLKKRRGAKKDEKTKDQDSKVPIDVLKSSKVTIDVPKSSKVPIDVLKSSKAPKDSSEVLIDESSRVSNDDEKSKVRNEQYRSVSDDHNYSQVSIDESPKVPNKKSKVADENENLNDPKHKESSRQRDKELNDLQVSKDLKNLSALLKKLEYYLSYVSEHRDDLIGQIDEIEMERLYLQEMKKSIDKQQNDKKDEIKIY